MRVNINNSTNAALVVCVVIEILRRTFGLEVPVEVQADIGKAIGGVLLLLAGRPDPVVADILGKALDSMPSKNPSQGG
jgi:hypothetical protein